MIDGYAQNLETIEGHLLYRNGTVRYKGKASGPDYLTHNSRQLTILSFFPTASQPFDPNIVV